MFLLLTIALANNLTIVFFSLSLLGYCFRFYYPERARSIPALSFLLTATLHLLPRATEFLCKDNSFLEPEGFHLSISLRVRPGIWRCLVYESLVNIVHPNLTASLYPPNSTFPPFFCSNYLLGFLSSRRYCLAVTGFKVRWTPFSRTCEIGCLETASHASPWHSACKLHIPSPFFPIFIFPPVSFVHFQFTFFSHLLRFSSLESTRS